MTTVIQPLSPHSAILKPNIVTPHRYRTPREWQLGCLRLLSQFDQNNDPTTMRIHNRRKNNVREKIRSTRRQPIPFPCRSLQRFPLMASIQKIPMSARKKLLLQPTQLMLLQQPMPILWLSLPPCQLIVQNYIISSTHRKSENSSKRPSSQSYHSNSSTHRIWSRHHSFDDPIGQTTKTKNWSTSKMIANHDRRGSRSAPDFAVIHMQVCKIRWNLLRQLSDQHGTETPRNEPEAED